MPNALGTSAETCPWRFACKMRARVVVIERGLAQPCKKMSKSPVPGASAIKLSRLSHCCFFVNIRAKLQSYIAEHSYCSYFAFTFTHTRTPLSANQPPR